MFNFQTYPIKHKLQGAGNVLKRYDYLADEIPLFYGDLEIHKSRPVNLMTPISAFIPYFS